MSTRSLSVVIPAFNAEGTIGVTLDALGAAASRAPALALDVILVDDGSSDDTARAAEVASAGRIPLRVIRQENSGRFEARRVGLNAATGDLVMLLDSRVTLHAGALAFLEDRLAQGLDVWNGHVEVADHGSLIGTFWRLLAELAWPAYFDAPRETSYGDAEFERYPKGTTCFVAPRALLQEAVAAFRSGYHDQRLANDDTPLLRHLAARRRINIAPGFACTYQPRRSLAAFLRHSLHRGVVFVDGHGRRESGYFPAVVAFYPVSLVLVAAAWKRPLLAPAALCTVSAAAGLLAARKGRRGHEVAAMALISPLYAVAHGMGMWKGAALLLSNARGRR